MIVAPQFFAEVPVQIHNQNADSNLKVWHPSDAQRRNRSFQRAKQLQASPARVRLAVVPVEPAREPGSIELQLANKRDQMFSAFGLVYKEYLRTGLTRSNPFEMRVTPYHLLPTTEVIVALDANDEAVCTVSLVRDGTLGLPMESLFAEVVAERRSRGVRLAEVTSLADNHDAEGAGRSLLMKVMSFMAQCARSRGIDELMITVHPHHVKFYQRFIGFETLGDARTYEAVLDNPAVPLVLDLKNLQQNHPAAYERFFGKPFPQEAFDHQPIPLKLRGEMRRVVAACNRANFAAASERANRAA